MARTRPNIFVVLLAIFGSTALIPSVARSQTTRIAYVASEAILERLPDARTARAKLAESQASWLREIARQQAEIFRLRQEIQTNRLLWSQQEKRDAEAALADAESKLAAFRSSKFGPKGEYEKLQGEVMAPIIDRIAKAIEEEARSQKYDYVVDKSSRGMSILYANPVHDITVAVLRRLGVEVTDLPEPPPPSATDAGSAEDDARRARGRRDRTPEKPLDPNEPQPTEVAPPSTPPNGGDSPD